jgi:phosphomannomutase
MALKFGTSGVRGLVTEMTDQECYLYTKAYVQYLQNEGPTDAVCIAGDFRGSSPRILGAVAFAINEAGLQVINCGFAPTPMLANHSLKIKAGAIMVTGSHIPDDRNGIKFYMPHGEILKTDEQQISALYAELKKAPVSDAFAADGMLKKPVELGEELAIVRADYIARYTDFFPAGCLAGLKLAFYQHSTVGRTIMPEVFEQLGAEVIRVGWSDSFVPVDTEAVANPEQLAAWVAEHNVDALASADGDCDRPLLVANDGKVIRGDILGILAADFLKADAIATPVSCNSALELSGKFANVRRTKIGSPFVIAAMNEAADEGAKCVIGYEANGGFLTGSDIELDGCNGSLTKLATRDAILPILAALVSAKQSGKTVAELLSDLPPRVTGSSLIRDFPSEDGQAITNIFAEGGEAVVSKYFADLFGDCIKLDMTDGARMTFADGSVVHVRPSGNAPEFRCYTEADTETAAQENNEKAQAVIINTLRPLVS